jgi:hypothetical protein
VISVAGTLLVCWYRQTWIEKWLCLPLRYSSKLPSKHVTGTNVFNSVQAIRYHLKVVQ